MTNIFKQNSILYGYDIVSELNDNLESGFYNTSFGF